MSSTENITASVYPSDNLQNLLNNYIRDLILLFEKGGKL